MPLEQTVTIVNNSGNIISTGKQLVSIFKEAKASYNEKKAEIKALRRAETFDQSSSTRHQDGPRRPRTLARHATYEPGYHTERDHGRNPEHQDGRRRSLDLYSDAGSRMSRSTSRSHAHSSYTKERHQSSKSRPALTASNLKTLSEISSTAPSQAPTRAPPQRATYRSPYAETLPKDSRISWMNLTQCDDAKTTAGPDWRQSTLVPRRRSEPEIANHLAYAPTSKGSKEIDMDLAYGEIPPDLADRVDLDPDLADEYEANQLVRRIEGLLDEAHCVQHSATSIIKHLQEKPDAAAAVALTLAELSSVLGKMSPAFLGFLKSGSPAVFALLASPQFLIGTGIAVVGLTVVMFGGWKIVKRVQERQASRAALAWQEAPGQELTLLRSPDDENHGVSVEEALIVDDDLSSIETWRRGILPLGADNESAEIELITPVAERAQRDKHGKDEFDLRSHRSTRTTRTDKTAKTSKTSKTAKTTLTTKTTMTAKTAKTAKTSKSVKTEKSSSSTRGREKENIPNRWFDRRATVESVASESNLGMYRSSRSERGERERSRERGVKMIEDGRSNGMELIFRPKAQSQGENMLKALFKNKDRKERESRTELVMA